jgi:uncharacterized protein
MIPKRVIIDTGPIIAFLNKSDHFHNWTIIRFSELNPPFLTCESVISEVCFLLRNSEVGMQNVFQLLSRGLIKIPFQLEPEISAISSLMKKYSDIPMSLADACLVRMSEQISDSSICTLDSDFKVYRKDKRTVIPVIMPEIQ